MIKEWYVLLPGLYLIGYVHSLVQEIIPLQVRFATDLACIILS